MDLLTDAIVMGESPRWHDGRLYVSDWGSGTIVAVDPDGKTEVAATITGRRPASTSCRTGGGWSSTATGCSSAARSAAWSRTRTCPAAGSYCNDIVVDGRGNAYVRRARVRLRPRAPFAPGPVALVRPAGEVLRVADDVAFPNGVAMTADNGTLVLAESYGNRLTAWDMAADGTLSGRRAWAELGTGVPDGICVDTDGAVWYADVPNRCCVRVADGGAVLDTVDRSTAARSPACSATRRSTSSRTSGAASRTSAAAGCYAVPAPAPGAGWPSSAITPARGRAPPRCCSSAARAGPAACTPRSSLSSGLSSGRSREVDAGAPAGGHVLGRDAGPDAVTIAHRVRPWSWVGHRRHRPAGRAAGARSATSPARRSRPGPAPAPARPRRRSRRC